jgi:hypothetical protein
LEVIESVVHGVSIFITEKMVVKRFNLLKITLANYCPTTRKKKKAIIYKKIAPPEALVD